MRRLLFTALFCCLSTFALAQVNPHIATQLPDNRSIDELSVKWWQWATNSPDVSDPLADDGGDFCGYGQTGVVWFLSGSYSTEKVVRRCKLPAGKYLFFPIINMMMWDSPEGQTCEELQADVRTAIDTVRQLAVEIDGKPVGNLQQYRHVTKVCFSIPGDDDHYASDGYWILLKPFSSGRHTIHFQGKIGDDGRTAEDFVQDIEYIIDVE